jgi:hypothetical protein
MPVTLEGSTVSTVNCFMTNTDVALLSETYLKPHEMFFIPNYHFYLIDLFPGLEGRTAVVDSKDILTTI